MHDDENLDEADERLVDAIRQLDALVAAPDDTRALDWPDEIGGFRVLDELAWSGQAVALLAYDTELKRNVVLKMHYRTKSNDVRQRVLDEGQNLAKIRSPHVAHCLGTGRYLDCPYLVLEHIEGVPLSDAPVRSSVDHGVLVRKLAGAVHEIHELGLTHGDIKPSNVVIDAKGNPFLIDLGSSTNAGAVNVDLPGTIFYTAPERARGESDFDRRRADVFSLGALLYFLLTHRAPFQADTRDEAMALARRNDFPPIPSSADPLLADVCRRCMADDPADRFSSVMDVESALARHHPARAARSKLGAGIAAGIGIIAVIIAASGVLSDPRSSGKSNTHPGSAPDATSEAKEGSRPTDPPPPAGEVGDDRG